MIVIEVSTTIASIIGLVGTVCAIVFGYIAFSRNKKLDDRSEAEQSGVVLTELGYIKSGVDDIKRKQDKQEERHLEVVTRLTAVEESTKQAHHQIDEIKTILAGK